MKALRNHLAILTFLLLAQSYAAEDSPFKYSFSFRHDDIVTCAAFSPDGRTLATASEVGTVIVTDMQSRKETALKNAESRGNGISTLSFSADGGLLLIGGWGDNDGGGGIRVRETKEYKVVATLKTSQTPIDFLRMSADGKWLIAGDRDAITVWNYAEKKVAHSFPLADTTIEFDGERTIFVGVGKAGTILKTAVALGEVLAIDCMDGTLSQVIPTLPKEPVRRLALAKSKKELFVLMGSGTVCRMDRAGKELKPRIALPELTGKTEREKFHIQRGTQLLVLESSPILAVNDRSVALFVNSESNKAVPLPFSGVGLAYSPDGKTLVLEGGVTGPLAPVPNQHYWTVNVFSFQPF